MKIILGIAAEAASWISSTSRIVGVGVDTASADPGRNHSYEAHTILANNQIYILENVHTLDALPGISKYKTPNLFLQLIF